MEFKVTLDDFWLDEDENIESKLKKYITDEVVRKITKSVEKKIDDHEGFKINRCLLLDSSATKEEGSNELA